MKIYYHKNFLKHYRQRIQPYKKLDRRFFERLQLLIDNPHNPLLRDHRLVGNKREYRSFALTGDLRVIYQKEGGDLLLYDIGTHSQVY